MLSPDEKTSTDVKDTVSFGTFSVSPRLEKIVVKDDKDSKSGGYGQVFLGKDEYGREDGTVIKLIKGDCESDLQFVCLVFQEYGANQAAFEICRCTPEPSKIWFEPDFALFSMSKLTELVEGEFTVEMYYKVDEYIKLLERNGIIHGDTRIGNVMKDSMGEPKLIDFGMAVYSDDPLGIIYDHFFLAYTMSLGWPNKSKGLVSFTNLGEYLTLTEDEYLKNLYKKGEWSDMIRYLQEAWVYQYRKLKTMEYQLDNMHRIRRLIPTGKFLPYFEGGYEIGDTIDYYRQQLQKAKDNVKWANEIQKRYDYAVQIGKRIEKEINQEWGRIDQEIKKGIPGINEPVVLSIQINTTAEDWNNGLNLTEILRINLRLPPVAIFLGRHYIFQYIQIVPDISPLDVEEIIVAGFVLAAEDLKIWDRCKSVGKIDHEVIYYDPVRVLEIVGQIESTIKWRYR